MLISLFCTDYPRICAHFPELPKQMSSSSLSENISINNDPDTPPNPLTPPPSPLSPNEKPIARAEAPEDDKPLDDSEIENVINPEATVQNGQAVRKFFVPQFILRQVSKSIQFNQYVVMVTVHRRLNLLVMIKMRCPMQMPLFQTIIQCHIFHRLFSFRRFRLCQVAIIRWYNIKFTPFIHISLNSNH